METYKNDYTQEEDELLWELHEIRHRLSEKYSKMSVDEINQNARNKFEQWKKEIEESKTTTKTI